MEKNIKSLQQILNSTKADSQMGVGDDNCLEHPEIWILTVQAQNNFSICEIYVLDQTIPTHNFCDFLNSSGVGDHQAQIDQVLVC